MFNMKKLASAALAAVMSVMTFASCGGGEDTAGTIRIGVSGSSTDILGGFTNSSGVVEIARKDNVFRMCFTDPNRGTASAEYIKGNNIGTNIAVIYDSSDAYSVGIYTKFMTKAAELGLNVVSETSFPSDDTTDFNVQLTEAKNAGADLIFLPIYSHPHLSSCSRLSPQDTNSSISALTVWTVSSQSKVSIHPSLKA